MSFFKNLFEKKTCDICGGEIGMLGNRKLADGNMCKDCAKKLSRWFEDRKEATVEQIHQQLHQRDVNFSDLQTFYPTISIGRDDHILFEEADGIPQRFIVTDQKDYLQDNPDIIRMDQVVECIPDIRVERNELERRDSEGKMVSYNPRRYEFKYDFYIDLIVEHPYISSMRFKLNPERIRLVDEAPTRGLGQFLTTFDDFDPSYDRQWREYKEMSDEIEQIFIQEQKRRASGYAQAAIAAFTAPAAAYEAPAEACEAPAAAYEAPVTGPKFCPNCGAPTGGAKFCGSCGTRLIG